MSYTIAIISLVLLITLAIYQIQVWKFRVLLSPAIYFSFMWMMGPIGCLVLYPLGFFYDPYPEYINELNILVAITAISFIFWTKFGRNRICENSILLDISKRSVFKFSCILILLAAFYDFISLGGNLNMGAARENLVEINASRSTLVGYAHVLCIPLSLYAGYILCRDLVIKYKLSSIMLFAPLVANLIFSVNVGGRVDIVYSFFAYIMGASLYLAINANLSRYKKPIFYVVIGVIIFMGFINYVGQQRQEYYNGTIDPTEEYLQNNNKIIAAIYGPIAYLNATYIGYQLRRVDAVDKDKLGYGRYTFNGFINWTIPFGNLIGLGDVSIAKSLNIYYHPQETYDFKREYYYTTHSCYLTMIKDFGFLGSIFLIFILTGIAHKLFIGIQKKQIICYATSLYLYYLFWNYWAKSPFYGQLSQGVLMPLYGFLLIDIFNIVAGKKRMR